MQQERRDRFTGGTVNALGPSTPPHTRFAGANTTYTAATVETTSSDLPSVTPITPTISTYPVSPIPHHVLRHRRPTHHSASYNGATPPLLIVY